MVLKVDITRTCPSFLSSSLVKGFGFLVSSTSVDARLQSPRGLFWRAIGTSDTLVSAAFGCPARGAGRRCPSHIGAFPRCRNHAAHSPVWPCLWWTDFSTPHPTPFLPVFEEDGWTWIFPMRFPFRVKTTINFESTRWFNFQFSYQSSFRGRHQRNELC